MNLIILLEPITITVIIVAAVAAAIGAIIGYFSGRSDSTVCKTFTFLKSEGDYCHYTDKEGKSYVIYRPELAAALQQELTSCPRDLEICFRYGNVVSVKTI
jgi:hypothetical protein